MPNNRLLGNNDIWTLPQGWMVPRPNYHGFEYCQAITKALQGIPLNEREIRYFYQFYRYDIPQPDLMKFMSLVCQQPVNLCAGCGQCKPSQGFREHQPTYRHKKQVYCEQCFQHYIRACDDCGTEYHSNKLLFFTMRVNANLAYIEKKVCRKCYENYQGCGQCGIYWPKENCPIGFEEVGTNHVCHQCLREQYYWCGNCHAWHENNYRAGRNYRCQCQPFPLDFELPLVHGGAQKSRERFEIEVPGGMLSPEGLRLIQRAIYNGFNGPYGVLTEDFDTTWQTKEGNFPKRLAKAMYKHNGFKAPEELIAQIGDIARKHTSKAHTYRMELDRDLNQNAAYWYNRDSCWFTAGTFGLSRCALKESGGFGIRFFNDANELQGRCWVAALRRTNAGVWATVPDTKADHYIVFNIYYRGNENHIDFARVMCQMTGKATYKRVTLTWPPMSINGQFGYLITDPETAAATARIDLSSPLACQNAAHPRAPWPVQLRVPGVDEHVLQEVA